MSPLDEICWEGLAGFEGNADLPSDAIVALGECRVSDNAKPIRSFVFKLLVDAFSNAGVVPTARAVSTTGDDLPYAINQ